jgi:hypothetical protein
LKAAGILLPHEKLREIGMDETKPVEIQVQALHACANYYAPRISPTVLLPTTIDLSTPPNDIPSILAAQSEVVQAMAAGRLEMTAGQALMNSLALMIRSREIGTGVSPPIIHIENNLPDLPIGPGDPANPAFAAPAPAEPAVIVPFSKQPQK